MLIIRLTGKACAYITNQTKETYITG